MIAIEILTTFVPSFGTFAYFFRVKVIRKLLILCYDDSKNHLNQFCYCNSDASI